MFVNDEQVFYRAKWECTEYFYKDCERDGQISQVATKRTGWKTSQGMYETS